MDLQSVLRRVDLFQPLLDEELVSITKAAIVRELRRGDVLFREDEASNDLFVVLDGRVAIAKRSPDGRESVLALMETDDVFGDMPLFDGLGRSAEARALEPSRVVQIPFEPVQQVYRARPELLWNVVSLLALRLRAVDTALADSVFLDVTGRTAKRLLELAGDKDDFVLPVTQEELAGMVGASRERVNKAIAAFVRLGWIEQHERRYRILDRPQLSLRAR